MLGEVTGELGEERKETFIAFGLSPRYCARNLIYMISLKLKTTVKRAGYLHFSDMQTDSEG